MNGITNNPNGRPKGTPNKTTAELREVIVTLFESRYQDFVDSLDQLDPKDKVDAYFKIMSFVLPKQKEVAIDKPVITTEFVITRHPAHDGIKRRPANEKE